MSTPRCNAEGGPDPRSAAHRSPDPATSALALALVWERTRRDDLEPGELLRWADELYDYVRTLLRDASVRRMRQSLPADVWSSLESVFWASAAARVTLSLLSEETVDNVEQDLHGSLPVRANLVLPSPTLTARPMRTLASMMRFC